MFKKATALLCTLILLVGMVSIPAGAATTKTKLIATNIPTSFPVIKYDPSFQMVNFWHAIAGFKGVAVNNMANWFNSTIGKKKKVYVKPIYQGDYDAIAMKISATIQSNNIKSLPDLVVLSVQGAFTLKESPYILYAEDMMKADPTFKILDKIYKNCLGACTYKGKILGMPFGNSMIMTHYNADAFKAAGIDPNSPPKTLAEYAEYAKKLVIKGTGSKPKRYGAACRVDSYELATWIPRSKSGTAHSFNNEDGRLGTPTKYVCGEEGTLKSVLTEWKKVVDTGAVEYNTTSPVGNFTNGQMAMFIQSMANYTTIDSNFASNPKLKFEHRIAKLPLVDASDAVGESIGGNCIYMLDRGNDAAKKATWEFVKFLASVDVAAYWYVQSGYFPMNRDAVNTKYVQDYQKISPNGKVIFNVLNDSEKYPGFQEPLVPNYGIYTTYTGDQITMMAQGKMTVDQVVANITKKASSMLKTYADANS